MMQMSLATLRELTSHVKEPRADIALFIADTRDVQAQAVVVLTAKRVSLLTDKSEQLMEFA
jgi:hypothetical protein